jgi:hypothetical protein
LHLLSPAMSPLTDDGAGAGSRRDLIAFLFCIQRLDGFYLVFRVLCVRKLDLFAVYFTKVGLLCKKLDLTHI